MVAPSTRVVTIFGGGGFIGREVLRRLSRAQSASEVHVRIASRNPALPSRLTQLAPSLGDIRAVRCDLTDDKQVAAALAGATHVVNCVGVLYETPAKGVTFRAVQQEGPAGISDALCTSAGKEVRSVVHLSAIGADKESKSAYARTKAMGEAEMLRLVADHSARLTVLRPSIVFGPEDSFFNRFNDMAKYLPFLPLVGGGSTKFQPVHVEDVAEAIVKSLDIDDVDGGKDNANGDGAKNEKERKVSPSGAVYELGGKTVLTFKQLMELVLQITGRRRLLVPIPFPVANIQGTLFESIHKLVPAVPPLLTRDQVELLRRDNVVSPGAKTLDDLGISGRACNEESVSYLRR